MPRVFDRRGVRRLRRGDRAGLAALGIDPAGYRERRPAAATCMAGGPAGAGPDSCRSTMLEHIGGVSHVRVVEPMRAFAALPGVTADIVPGLMLDPPPHGRPISPAFSSCTARSWPASRGWKCCAP